MPGASDQVLPWRLSDCSTSTSSWPWRRLKHLGISVPLPQQHEAPEVVAALFSPQGAGCTWLQCESPAAAFSLHGTGQALSLAKAREDAESSVPGSQWWHLCCLAGLLGSPPQHCTVPEEEAACAPS